MKKRLVSGMLVACMLLASLSACNKKETKENETTTQATQTQTYPTYDFFNKLLNRAEAPANTVVYNYADFVDLGEYKGVDAEVDPSEKVVSDEEYEESLESLLSNYSETEEIKTGKTADGDTINLDFKGLLNGEAFEGGTSTDYTYTIGGNFIEDLDRGLIGLEVGKTVSIPCTFPEDYGKEELNGKDVVFEVTVNYISKTNLPELTDDLAKKIAEEQSLTEEFTTADGLEEYLKEALQEQADATFENNKFFAAWENVKKNATFKGTPQLDYKLAYDSMVANAQSQFTTFQSYGYEWAEFLKLYGFETEDAFEEYCNENATDYIQTKLIMMAIAEKEGLTVTEEEYKECAQAYVEQYQYDDLATLEEALGDDKFMFVEERYYEVIYNEVYDIIADSCKEVEKTEESTEESSTKAE